MSEIQGKSNTKYKIRYQGVVEEFSSLQKVDEFIRSRNINLHEEDAHIRSETSSGDIDCTHQYLFTRVYFRLKNKLSVSINSTKNPADNEGLRKKKSMFDYVLSFGEIVPKAYREEVKADLIALKNDLEIQGYSRFWKFLRTLTHLSTIIFFTYKMKLGDYLQPKESHEIQK